MPIDNFLPTVQFNNNLGARKLVASVATRYSAYATVRYVSLPSFSAFDGRSFRQIFQVPYRGACLVRAVYETSDVSGGTITETAFAAGRAIANDNPIDADGVASVWGLSGATTITAASASYSSNGVYGQGKSAWVPLNIPAPIDSGAGGYVYVGTIASSAPRFCIVGNASRPTSDWELTVNSILPAMKYRSMYNSGADNVTTNQNAFVSVAGAVYFNPCSALDVIPAMQCVYGAFYGDSTTQGFGVGSPSIEPQSYSWGHVAANIIRQNGVPLVMSNYGMEGKDQTFYLARLTAQLTDSTFTPGVVIIQPFSTNGGFTTAAINTGITLALTAASSARSKGIKVVLTTVAPTSSTDATTDAARKAGNLAIINSGENVLDISGLLSDNASIERIRSEFTTDGTHFNIAGNNLIGRSLADIINMMF